MTLYQPTNDGAEMLAEIQAALDKCDHLSASLDRLDEEAAAAQAAVDGATQKRAQLLADRAMCTESAEVKAFNAPLKKVAEAASEAALELEAVQVARQTLEERLLAAEEELRSLSSFNVQMMLGQYAEAARDLVDEELTAAARSLLPILREVAALQAATEDGALARVLNETALYTTRSIHPVLTGNAAQFDAQENPRQAWHADTELQALHQAASAGRLLAAKVRGYVPRKSRKVLAKPYQLRGYSKDGELTRAAMATRAEPETSTAGAVPPAAPKASAEATTDRQRDPLREKPARTASSRPPAEIVDGNVARGLLNNLMRD